MADTLTRNQKAYRRRVEKEANSARFPAKLTANPAKAALVRDPDTGRKFDRKTEVFKKCLTLFSPRF